ncbi:helix-turn-helix domain-containing protein [Curtobacterium sp. RRHDQ10]|uniref:TetR/AcrR family transcriptional regulator n=1 Tax=Curtobacterium phyllosphaerae TaxID=3413379 RepID=UPI003BF29AD2
MSRWQPDARGRLAQAAMQLFEEQGFAATTVPEIAARAGLTTRTFFRHYADKREVLFAYQQELPAVVAEVLAAAPDSMAPMDVIGAGLRTLAVERFEEQRSHFLAHRDVVRSDDGLQERELWKRAVLGEAMRSGFLARGADELTAMLVAELGVTAFSVATARWLDDESGRPLVSHVEETLAELAALATSASAPGSVTRTADPRVHPGSTGRAEHL